MHKFKSRQQAVSQPNICTVAARKTDFLGTNSRKSKLENQDRHLRHAVSRAVQTLQITNITTQAQTPRSTVKRNKEAIIFAPRQKLHYSKQH